jgi:hypothetical protein
MHRFFALLLALSMVPVLFAGPVAATDRLDIQIDTVDIPEPPASQGTFTVSGEGAALLCPSGTWESGEGRFWDRDNGFKISVERTFTCDGTGETFVLELTGTIVFGEGCSKNCTWKLKDSTGFDPAPKGRGDIVGLSPLGESYVGSIKG